MHESIHTYMYVCIRMHACIMLITTIHLHYNNCYNSIEGLFLDLNKLITKVTKKIENAIKQEKKVHGSISYHSSPPAGIPKWMLRPSTGIHGQLAFIPGIYTHFSYSHIIVNAENTDSLENGIIDHDRIETVDVPGMFV